MSAHDPDLGRFGHRNPDLPLSAQKPLQQPSGGQGEYPPPDAHAPSTFAGVPVAAMEAAMAERTKQIALGHTPQADLRLDNPKQLPATAIRYLNLGIEDVQFHKGDWQTRAKRHFAQAAALALAAWDYIDNGGGQ